MTFLTPWLLFGTLLTGVPLAIHLLNKPRYRRHDWGAMMFLKTAMEKRSRRIKLHQLLLLILRMLIPVLLAWALARPVIRSTGFLGGGHQPTTHVLALDGSYSMRQGQSKENAFKSMIETAKKIVDSMADQDNAMFIWAGNKPRALTPRPLFNRADLTRILDDLEPGWETADMPRALEQAMWMLSLSRLPRHRIHVLSDLQQTGWSSGEDAEWNRFNQIREDRKISPAIYTVARQSSRKIRNMAVTELRTRYPLLDIHREAVFITEIHNYCDEDKQAEIVFIVDDQEMERKQTTLKTGVNTAHFKHRFEKPGSHAVEVFFREDDLPVDNRKALAVEVLQTIPVLIIEGVTDDNTFASPGAMLGWALEAGGKEGKHLFDVTTISETELASLTYADLIGYKSVLLVNVRSLTADFTGVLKQYVREGGGLLIGLGNNSPPEQYNSLYEANQGLLPAKIGSLQKSGAKPLRPSFPAGPATEILKLFDVTRTRTLKNINVQTFRQLKPAPETTVTGLLEDEPFFALKNYGEGCVSIWSISFNLEWSNMPAVPDFVPLMQNLVFHLSSSVIPPVNLSQNETLVYSYSRSRSLFEHSGAGSVAGSGRPATCTVIDPEGKTNNIELISKMGESVAYFGDTVKPGIYTVKADGALPRHYAVSLPSGEGNLAALNPNETKWLSNSTDMKMIDNIASLRRAIKKETGVNDLCTPLLVATLLALAAESILAAKCSGEKQTKLRKTP